MGTVFLVFLRLGLTSFGGPIAHIGYFRREFVERRGWLSETAFSEIVAFCSLLPGPTSSQVGLLTGLARAGPGGALAAWAGFTLPSALVLALCATALVTVETHGAAPPPAFGGLLAGLAAAAAAVVAQAVFALARTQCPDRATRTIAIGAAILALVLAPAANLQWLPIAVGAGLGAAFLRGCDLTPVDRVSLRVPRPVALACGALFVALVLGSLAVARTSSAGALIATLVRAGSLVFGGGHVVLPLLQSATEGGLISQRDFFAGYGLTQAMPGPLFTFASFLGAANLSPLHGPLGALVATVVIFLPSFLLVFALWPVWDRLRCLPALGGALGGAGAAVVGLLAAVLYSPILTSLGGSTPRVAIAFTAFALIEVWRLPPWVVVVVAALAGSAGAAAGAAI